MAGAHISDASSTAFSESVILSRIRISDSDLFHRKVDAVLLFRKGNMPRLSQNDYATLQNTPRTTISKVVE